MYRQCLQRSAGTGESPEFVSEWEDVVKRCWLVVSVLRLKRLLTIGLFSPREASVRSVLNLCRAGLPRAVPSQPIEAGLRPTWRAVAMRPSGGVAVEIAAEPHPSSLTSSVWCSFWFCLLRRFLGLTARPSHSAAIFLRPATKDSLKRFLTLGLFSPRGSQRPICSQPVRRGVATGQCPAHRFRPACGLPGEPWP